MTDERKQPIQDRQFQSDTMSRPGMESTISLTMQHLASIAITVEEMLVQARYSLAEGYENTKEKVYQQILQYLRIETHHGIINTGANINNFVYATISPIIDDFICNTTRATVDLHNGGRLVSENCETGGDEEFVVLDRMSATGADYIPIIQAKTASLGAAMGQCLSALRGMGNRGVVYGFVTTGGSWWMLSYDGRTFQVTHDIAVVFDTMATNKEKWMKEFSVLVDCVYAALRNGGSIVVDVAI